MAQFDFTELISYGKEIDRTVTFLSTKLLEPSKFGNGQEARLALNEVREEITEINSMCRNEINRRSDEYESAFNCNKMVNDYLDKVDEILDKLESEALPYGYESYCPQKENNAKNSQDFLSVSGVESLSVCDPVRLTPIIMCHGGNRKLQFNDTLSSWSTTSPIRSTPRVGNSFLSSTALNSWQQKPTSKSSNSSHVSYYKH